MPRHQGKQCSDLHCSNLPWGHIHAFLFTVFCTLYTKSCKNKTLYFVYTVVRNGVLWITNMSPLTNIFIPHRRSAGEIQESTFLPLPTTISLDRTKMLYEVVDFLRTKKCGKWCINGCVTDRKHSWRKYASLWTAGPSASKRKETM